MENPIIAAPESKPVTMPPVGTPPGEPPQKSAFLSALSRPDKKPDEVNPPVPAGKPVAVVDDDAPAEILSDKGKGDWRKIKEARQAAENKAKELEAKYTTETGTLKEQIAAKERELAEARSAFDPAEVERLRGDHKTLKEELNLLDVTRSSEWRQHFVAPVESATKLAISLLPDEAKGQAEWYLNQPDSPQRTDALEQIIVVLSPLKVGKFTNALSVIDSTRERANALLADNAGLVARFQKGKQVERDSLTLQQRVADGKTFESVRDRVLAAKMPWASDPAVYEKAAADGIERAKSYFDSTDTDTRARIANWAAFGEASLPQIQNLQKELAAALETIAKLSSAGTKSPGGSGVSGAPTAAPKGNEFMSQIRSA